MSPGRRRITAARGDHAELITIWRDSLVGLSNRTKTKLLVVLGGVMGRAQHVWGLPINPVSISREAARSLERGHRCRLARGGAGAGARGRLGPGCRDLPDRGLHRASPRRAARTALARRRLLELDDPSAR